MNFLSEPAYVYRPDTGPEDNDFCLCLERIDLLFQQDYLLRMDEPPAGLQDFFLPEEAIRLRLGFPHGVPYFTEVPGAYLPDTGDALTQRLRAVVAAFDLTDVERDILLTGMLPRLSGHYAMLPNGDLKEGIGQPLLYRLFAGTQMAYRQLQSALHPSSPLFRFHLMSEEKNAGKKAGGPVYRVSASVWHYFCGDGAPVTDQHPYTRWAVPGSSAWYPQSLCENISRLCLRHSAEVVPMVVVEGQELDGRELALATIVAEYGYAMLCIDVESLPDVAETQQGKIMAEIIRDALLSHAVLLLENGEPLASEKNGYLREMERLLPQVKLPVLIMSDAAAHVPVFRGLTTVHLSMPPLAAEEKAQLLQGAWPASPNEEEKRALFALAQRYAFNPADAPLLMQEADYYRQIRDENAPLIAEDLRQTLARRSRKNFGKLAQRIAPVRTFDDMILSPALQKQLNEILATIRLRESVTEKHFSRKTAGKIGISALFYGDSGTGKTLAAEVLAQHLGVDLIKVDLSTVVNKYIGETEKNLARIFDLAQADSGVLFFDEADALFGKRSETKDAHDRHANIEVSYLLQRLENYPGLVILATNNRNHLDSAFNRRFTFITRFTYPDVSLRTQLWRSVWPETLELAEDVDFSALAARSELTGANIRNVALLAAVLAAEGENDRIHLHHIEKAIARELGKLGRVAL
ncbi:AAA family ATPase [Serratia inhibens]|uniref:AAA family ATPase n=1 Tax=Serratia inhibens TaxID=2338073 RepID=A0AA93BZW7_9GAMM|nr:AAA family ATPase [Serratia inhibens]RJF58556.1 AAA family ATPase [Serratia inhibens]